MSKIWLAPIYVFVEADNYAEACDAVSESMREIVREYVGPQSSVIDWQHIAGANGPRPATKQEIESMEFQP